MIKKNVGKYQSFQNVPLGQTHDNMTIRSNMTFWYIQGRYDPLNIKKEKLQVTAVFFNQKAV